MKIVGHRGWRGQYPENSLQGFEQLSLAGIHALELDLVVNKDKQLIVSHEPWFDDRYCISASKSNLYTLSLEQIQSVDCGSKIDDRFPTQTKVQTYKPSMLELVQLWQKLGVRPFIAIEIKSETKYYGSYQPYAQEFAELLMAFEQQYLQGFDYFIQSFDPYFLKIYHQLNPSRATGLLVENNWNPHQFLDYMDYTPDFYNPEHILLTEQLMQTTQSLGMKTYTWTVNELADYQRIKDFLLEGVISDYPERFV